MLFLEDLRLCIGKNLKNIRKDRQLSLDELSKLTDVSASMLGEIERGVTNPTITVLWKISNGLKVPLSSLMKEGNGSSSVVYYHNSQIYLEGEGFKIFSLFGFDQDKKTEIFFKTFEPGSQLESEGHGKGVEECVLVADGTLTIEANNEVHRLSKGDAINFTSGMKHSYTNYGTSSASAFVIIYYGS